MKLKGLSDKQIIKIAKGIKGQEERILSIELPVEIAVTDYHEADILKEYLETLTDERIRTKEVGFEDGLYWIMIY